VKSIIETINIISFSDNIIAAADNNGVRAHRIYTKIFQMAHKLPGDSIHVLVGYDIFEYIGYGLKFESSEVDQEPNMPRKIGHLSELILYVDNEMINGSSDIECFDSMAELKNKYLPIFRNNKLKIILEDGNI
jgi:hypothetical protein